MSTNLSNVHGEQTLTVLAPLQAWVPTERIAGLDGIRAIAVLMVLVNHLYGVPGFPAWPWLQAIKERGAFGVQIFFVLSGFLITHLLVCEETRSGTFSIGAFYQRRAIRILPPAFLYLTALVALWSVSIIPLRYADILASLLFVRNLVHASGVTDHFWTLAIEEQFYFIWPALLFFIRGTRTRLAVAIILVAIAPLWRQFNYHYVIGANVGRLDIRYDSLVMGCLLALLQKQYPADLRRIGNPFIAAAALGTLALMLTPWSDLVPWLFRPYRTSALFLCVALIINFLVCRQQSIAVRILEIGLLVWIGRLSYSLYLWQQLFSDHSSLPRSFLLWFPGNIVATFAAATASYYLLERPLLKLRARLR